MKSITINRGQIPGPSFITLLLIVALSSGCIRVITGVLKVEPGVMTRMKVEKNLMVPMKDGVRLATDVYRPDDQKAHPVILTRLPYGTDVSMFEYLGKYFVRNGYVFVAQDTRGTFASEGPWFPFIFEFDDGHDTLNWISEQAWSNGKIGMFGGSYFGYTQLVAAPNEPKLDCMVPIMTSGNMRHVVFRGGAQEFLSIVGWSAGMKNAEYERLGLETRVEADFTGGYYNAPIRDARPIDYDRMKNDPEILAQGVDPWLEHPGDIELVPPLNYEEYYSQVSAPSLMIVGWYDIFLGAQVQDFLKFQEFGQGAAKESKMIIGPWSHGGFFYEPEKNPLGGIQLMAGDLLAWYDYWLKGEDRGVLKPAPITLYVMGENVWRDEQEWPLARTQYKNFYFHSRGSANTDSGDGRLSTQAPVNEPADHYFYDPRDPVPTAGGCFLGGGGFDPGPQDQGGIPERQDVLVFMTEPLERPLEVTGPIELVLYAASSARDTDWVAKLMDVDEKGAPRLLTLGIIRARYRNGIQSPSALEPGQVYEYAINLWSTSNLFQKGHRIAVWVTSSDFPQFDRNTNAAGEGGPENIIVAEQTVYHDSQRPSHVILPVIPR